jgi:hypothetical protein
MKPVIETGASAFWLQTLAKGIATPHRRRIG